MPVSNLSEIARNNLIKLTKDYGVVDKYKDSRRKCHVDGKSIPDIAICIDNSIPNKSIASFWKAYVRSLEFVFRKEKVEAEFIANSMCLSVK